MKCFINGALNWTRFEPRSIYIFLLLSFLSLIKNYSRAFEQNSGSITASSKTSISAENIVIIFDFFLFESLKYFLQEDDGFMELR